MVSSRSIPGKRLANDSPSAFLSSALAGMPATAFPSLFAVSSTLFASGSAAQSSGSRSRIIVAKIMISVAATFMLFENFVSDFCGFHPVIVDCVFAVVFQSVIFFYGEKIFRCAHAVFDHPFGIYVEAPRRLSHRFAVKLLSFLGEQPVDENFRGVRMRRAFNHRQSAAPAARIGTFFHVR